MATPALSQPCFVDLTLDQQNFNIYDSLKQIAGFDIPAYDQIDIDYYGSTNNIYSVQYLYGGVPVATLMITYMVNPPIVNDERIAVVQIDYP